jgi:hypothetical protein
VYRSDDPLAWIAGPSDVPTHDEAETERYMVRIPKFYLRNLKAAGVDIPMFLRLAIIRAGIAIDKRKING